jgi:hypothetical protein
MHAVLVGCHAMHATTRSSRLLAAANPVFSSRKEKILDVTSMCRKNVRRYFLY